MPSAGKIAIVLYTYDPAISKDGVGTLCLHAGERVRILWAYDDGWFDVEQVQRQQSGADPPHGLVPGSYLLQQRGTTFSLDPLIDEAIRYLARPAVLATDGLYREYCSESELRKYQQLFRLGNRVDLVAEVRDPHVVANLLKTHLREAEVPLISDRIYSMLWPISKQLVTAVESGEEDLKDILDSLNDVMQHMSVKEFNTAINVFSLLKITADCPDNRMTDASLAMVLAPHLTHRAFVIADVIVLCIANFEYIFLLPETYTPSGDRAAAPLPPSFGDRSQSTFKSVIVDPTEKRRFRKEDAAGGRREIEEVEKVRVVEYEEDLRARAEEVWTDRYGWRQTNRKVVITFALPDGASKADIKINFAPDGSGIRKHLRVWYTRHGIGGASQLTGSMEERFEVCAGSLFKQVNLDRCRLDVEEVPSDTVIGQYTLLAVVEMDKLAPNVHWDKLWEYEEEVYARELDRLRREAQAEQERLRLAEKRAKERALLAGVNVDTPKFNWMMAGRSQLNSIVMLKKLQGDNVPMTPPSHLKHVPKAGGGNATEMDPLPRPGRGTGPRPPRGPKPPSAPKPDLATMGGAGPTAPGRRGTSSSSSSSSLAPSIAPSIAPTPTPVARPQPAAPRNVPAPPPRPADLLDMASDQDYAIAMYDFAPRGPQDLGFRKGQVIALRDAAPTKAWWVGELMGKTGKFPASYTKPLARGVKPAQFGGEKAGSRGIYD